MDPTENLKEQREIIEIIQRHVEAEHLDTVPPVQLLIRLVELHKALDEWLSQGNFLPRQWDKKEKEQCIMCKKFFVEYSFRCNKPEECDCPKCQGFCECDG